MAAGGATRVFRHSPASILEQVYDTKVDGMAPSEAVDLIVEQQRQHLTG